MRVHRVLVVAFVCVAVSAQVSEAQAGHGSGSGIGNPDNVNHYVDRNSITADIDYAVSRGIAQLNRSVMNATLSGTGDVEVWDNYYGTTSAEWAGHAALADCVVPAGAGVCDKYRIRYNLSYIAGYTNSELSSAGCHEFGHTAGLGHRPASGDTDNNSCMRAAFDGNRPGFDSHDLDAINNIF